MATRLKSKPSADPVVYATSKSTTIMGENEKIVRFTPAVKGEIRNPRGRPKGARNKVQREIREALLEAGHLAGFDIVVDHTVIEELRYVREKYGDEVADDPGVQLKVRDKVRANATASIVDYFREMAHKEPASFMATIGKVLPKQLDVNLQLTSRDVLDTMSKRRDTLADQRAAMLEAVKDVDYHAGTDQ